MEIAAVDAGAVEMELSAQNAGLAGELHPRVHDRRAVGRDARDDARRARSRQHLAGQKAAPAVAAALVARDREVDLVGKPADGGEVSGGCRPGL